MGSDPDEYADLAKTRGIAGFKPYHFSSKCLPSADSGISEFLPEWVWELADKEKLVITLHIVRKKALSDPENQRQIKSMCLKYSEARLVLAHAGRGFKCARHDIFADLLRCYPEVKRSPLPDGRTKPTGQGHRPKWRVWRKYEVDPMYVANSEPATWRYGKRLSRRDRAKPDIRNQFQ